MSVKSINGMSERGSANENHELDVVDRTILNILQRNAKCPLKEIAAIWKNKDTDRIFNFG